MHKNTVNKNLYSNRYLSAILIFIAVLLSGCAGFQVLPDLDSESAVEPEITLEDILKEGDEAISAGDIDAAQVSYALAVERDKNNIPAVYKLAFVHHRKKSNKVAESLLRHALSVDNSHIPAKLLLAKVLLQVEREDEAEFYFKSVLSGDEFSVDALNGLGVISDMKADHLAAQKRFLQALEIIPRSPKFANNLGYSYYLAGDFANAEFYFQEAIKFNFNHRRAWSNLALVYSRTNRIRDADAAFQKITTAPQAANNIGYLKLLQGDKKSAKEYLSRAAESAPLYYELANRNLQSIDEFEVLPANEGEKGEVFFQEDELLTD